MQREKRGKLNTFNWQRIALSGNTKSNVRCLCKDAKLVESYSNQRRLCSMVSYELLEISLCMIYGSDSKPRIINKQSKVS